MAILMMRPELDQWQPGEHTGTFRGNNLGFVAATAALNRFWTNDDLTQAVEYKGNILEETLTGFAESYPELDLEVRGLGMAWGLDFKRLNMASEASRLAFERGVLIETSGAESNVLKFLMPLIIEEDLLREGLDVIGSVLQEMAGARKAAMTGAVA